MPEKFIVLTSIIIFGACGIALEKKKPQTADAILEIARELDTRQLKGTDLLAQSLYNTLGPRMNIRVDEENETEEDLFVIYGDQFGLTSGLRIGESYADGPSLGYFMSLAVVAANASTRCVEENTTTCRCDDHASASAMIRRAIPSIDLNQQPGLVDDFATHCGVNQSAAIRDLVSSIAFAIRQ